VSVREQLFVRTRKPPAVFAEEVARLIGGRVESATDHAVLLVDTARLVPGATGEFGGPVLAHASEAEFRPDGEFEAADAYNVEIRLWQAHGPRIDPATGTDVEAAAATAMFDVIAQVGDAPIIHVRDDDRLVAAAMPGRGVVRPEDTTTYDWDAGKWDGYVLVPTRAD
jgi:hypothetical protein